MMSSSTSRRTVLSLLTALGFAVALGLPTASLAKKEPHFADLDGGSVSLSQLRGEVVFVHFWATWCGPCRQEMPEIVKLHEELGPRGLRVQGISANGKNEADAVRSAMKKLNMRFDSWVWASAGDMARYGVGPTVPCSVLVDAEGNVRHRFKGKVTAEQVKPLAEALLWEAGKREAPAAEPKVGQ